jgi:hypothetical protein
MVKSSVELLLVEDNSDDGELVCRAGAVQRL